MSFIKAIHMADTNIELWVRNQTEDLTRGLNLIPVGLQASMFLRQSVIVIWSALTTIVFRLTKL